MLRSGSLLDLCGAFTELAPEVVHLHSAVDVHVSKGAKPIVSPAVDAVQLGLVAVGPTVVPNHIHIRAVSGVDVGQFPLFERGAVVLFCPPSNNRFNPRLLAPTPLPIVGARVENGLVLCAMQMHYWNLLDGLTIVPVVVGHRSPHGANATERVRRPTGQAVAHVTAVGIPAAVGACRGVTVFCLKMLSQLDEELQIGL